METTITPATAMQTDNIIDLGLVAAAVAPVNASTHPARVYLAGLRSRSSEPTQRRSLVIIGRMLFGLPLDENRRSMSQTDKAIARDEDEAVINSTPWSQLRYQHVAALASRLAAAYAPATANRILAALKGVLKEAWRLGQMSADEYTRAVDVDAIAGERLPAGRSVQSSELSAMLDTCEPTRTGIRDAAIIAVMYVTGMRRSELVGLDLSDYADGAITIRKAKRNKQRVVHVTNGARAALEDWISTRGDEAGPLFTGTGNRQSGGRLTAQAVYKMLDTRQLAAGLSASLSPHDLRRTCAGDLLDAGVDLITVSRILGHSDPRTTARYDRRPDAVKREAAGRLHVPYRRRTMLAG